MYGGRLAVEQSDSWKQVLPNFYLVLFIASRTTKWKCVVSGPPASSPASPSLCSVSSIACSQVVLESFATPFELSVFLHKYDHWIFTQKQITQKWSNETQIFKCMICLLRKPSQYYRTVSGVVCVSCFITAQGSEQTGAMFEKWINTKPGKLEKKWVVSVFL